MTVDQIVVTDDFEEQHRIQREKNRGGIALLEGWLREPGDPTSDEEFWPLVKAGLDEGRGSQRKLFND